MTRRENGYHTPRGDSEKLEELGEILTKIEIFLTTWSVAQAGSNDEKKGGRKSRWTVPIKDTCNPHMLMFNLSANH